MGVVYKAKDTHLDRLVAIKLLPAERVADPERKRRFIQEAKAASALNHPNIITIYDIDVAEGVHFIAMEYVDGKTLGQWVSRKGLKLQETLKHGIQIADALAAAHAAGIVHRDLKPANIMVTEKGLVKVLDFGLAKLTEADSGYEGETLTDRGDAPRTEQGAILGTVAYMSPEQAEGKKIDARSDIFSFGSVLYEMITGRRAFRGETRVSTLSAILKEDPQPISTIVEDSPRELERIVARCLRKDPARRFQHIDDVKIALEELKEESDSGKLAIVSAGANSKRAWRLIAAAGLLACVAGGIWLLRQYQNNPPATPQVLPLTYFAGVERFPSFSPDGKQVAFSWDGEKRDNEDIYVKLVNSETALRLTTDPAPDIAPAWSPDGSQIAFIRLVGDQAAIFLTSPLGGAERKLAGLRQARHFSSAPSISWSPDAEWLVVVEADAEEGNGLSLVPVRRGAKRKLVSSPVAVLGYVYPAFSPDGRSLAFAGCKGERSCDVYLQDLDRNYLARGPSRRLTNQGAVVAGIAWAPDGRSVLYAASPDMTSPFRLWRLPVSSTGRPELLSWAGDGVTYPALSRTGNRLAYTRVVPGDSGIWKFEAGVPPAKFSSTTRPELDPQFSPDGKRVAFSANRTGQGSELWVSNHDGTNQARLTEGTGRMLGGPRWSPDSRWIVYNAQQEDGRWEIFRIDSAGGQMQNLTAHPSDDNLPSYSRDGNWIYFSSNRTGSYEIYRMPAAGGEPRQITDNGGFEALESCDRQTLYYSKGWYSGLYARPVAGGPEKPVLESVALSVLSFVVVENGIYYVSRGARGSRTLEIRFLNFTTGKSQTVTQVAGNSGQGLTVSPDRKTMLYTISGGRNDDLMLVENFR